jgi:hypothetical protein
MFPAQVTSWTGLGSTLLPRRLRDVQATHIKAEQAQYLTNKIERVSISHAQGQCKTGAALGLVWDTDLHSEGAKIVAPLGFAVIDGATNDQLECMLEVLGAAAGDEWIDCEGLVTAFKAPPKLNCLATHYQAWQKVATKHVASLLKHRYRDEQSVALGELLAAGFPASVPPSLNSLCSFKLAVLEKKDAHLPHNWAMLSQVERQWIRSASGDLSSVRSPRPQTATLPCRISLIERWPICLNWP